MDSLRSQDYPHGAGLKHPFFGAVLVALVLRCGFVPAAPGCAAVLAPSRVVAPLGRLMWSGQVFRAAPVTSECLTVPAFGDTLTRFWTGLYHEMVTAWRVEALVNYFQMVAVEVGERQVIADAQGRAADGTWLTTL